MFFLYKILIEQIFHARFYFSGQLILGGQTEKYNSSDSYVVLTEICFDTLVSVELQVIAFISFSSFQVVWDLSFLFLSVFFFGCLSLQKDTSEALPSLEASLKTGNKFSLNFFLQCKYYII